VPVISKNPLKGSVVFVEELVKNWQFFDSEILIFFGTGGSL
jgi:hypothetical protein